LIVFLFFFFEDQLGGLYKGRGGAFTAWPLDNNTVLASAIYEKNTYLRSVKPIRRYL